MAEFAIFLTQDAILASPDALQQQVAAFDDPQVAATYGRQLAHANATPNGTPLGCAGWPLGAWF